MNLTKSTIILAITALIGAGLFLLSQNKHIPPQTPGEVSSAFYKSYQECLKNPPPGAVGEVSVYCQTHSGLTSAEFSQHLLAGGVAQTGADPVGCAQNPPNNFLVSDATLQDDHSAKVVVKEFFAGTRLDIPVLLIVEDGQWKIDNIVCPRPDPASNPEITDSWPTYTNDNSHISFKSPVSAGSSFSPTVKTTGTGTQVTFQSIGSEFSFVIQPIKPGVPQYFENSIFQESNQIGPFKWDVSLSVQPAFVAYQTVKNNTRYVFVFTHQTEKDELQHTILSTFKFLDPKETTITVNIGEKISALGISITPQQILEDSRCAQDVQCIQAGTVRLKALLESGMGTASQVFVIGKTITTETEEITLSEVSPRPTVGKPIQPNEYQFTFQVRKRI